MSEEKNQGVPQLYPTEKVEESSWNMNRMETPEYEALKADMKAHGPEGIDPISMMKLDLIPKGPFDYVVIDGNHRLRAAKELKWPYIRAVVAEGFLASRDEETARSISYAKNRERGHIDPWLEAKNFQWLKEKGWNLEKIAKEYRVDRSQVSKRLSLLNLVPDVKEQVEKVTQVTASHFEPIATLPKTLQITAAKEIKDLVKHRLDEESALTVRGVESVVKEVKKEDAVRRELEAQVAKYEHKKCPTCKKDPVRKDSRGYPWVMCEQYHSWNLRTGKTEREEVAERYPEAAEAMKGAKPEKKPFPDYIRTTYTVEDFAKAFNNRIKEMLPEFAEIRKIDIGGILKNGEELTIGAELGPTDNPHAKNYMHFFLQQGLDPFKTYGRKGYEEMNVERKEYEKEDLKDFKTAVTTFPAIHSMKGAKALQERVNELFNKFGEVVHVKPKGPKKGKKDKR